MTRRGLLTIGLSASAVLITTDRVFAFADADAARAILQAPPEPAIPNECPSETASPRENLLLDFGWRFHLGDADDAVKDFRWGAPAREGTFAKAGHD